MRPSDFARQHGIDPRRFFCWQYKLRPRLGPEPRADFVQVEVPETAGPIPAAGGDAPLEVHLGQARILLREGCSAELLRRLWSVVREAGC